MLIKKRISISYFLRFIRWDLLAIACYALLAGTFDHYGILADVKIPLAVTAFTGTVLSLLLAFRTSQSYERWWEARVVWGAIVNDSRSLIRQVKNFMPNTPEGLAVTIDFARRQGIWCFTLSESLRKCEHSTKVKDYFAAKGEDSANKPNRILDHHAEALAQAAERFGLNPNKQVQIDNTIVKLCDSMGKCERIKNTVFPNAYSVLIHCLIYVLMTMLPFGLEDQSKLVEISLTIIVPALFIAIEQTAILMQDPFENRPTDTPMTTLSKSIENTLLEMVGQPPANKIEPPTKYYVM
ncbi:bestrophin family protein [Mucilaginibacter terrae]|uniref:Membrane protein n=1 Tax=Mucilaginibacter terrae TaxID=1955052 RepID=A0ABU3GNM9_9SPHI|nr:bestrophin family ion channel [Mucilaginibacter terrae]MDT3401385.1 putative membrane protein [Mucilaginibacter terrae]